MMEECYPPHFGRYFLENLQPFPTQLRLEIVEACNVSARMRQARNKPASDRIGDERKNTIGMVCVCCNRAATAGLVVAKITSGATATRSRAAMRMRSVTPPVNQYSTRMLRPSIQPRS